MNDSTLIIHFYVESGKEVGKMVRPQISSFSEFLISLRYNLTKGLV